MVSYLLVSPSWESEGHLMKRIDDILNLFDTIIQGLNVSEDGMKVLTNHGCHNNYILGDLNGGRSSSDPCNETLMYQTVKQADQDMSSIQKQCYLILLFTNIKNKSSNEEKYTNNLVCIRILTEFKLSKSKAEWYFITIHRITNKKLYYFRQSTKWWTNIPKRHKELGEF